MNRVLLLSLWCLPLLGCATTIGLPLEDRKRVYEEDFDTVFKAAAHTLYREGYDLYDIDYLGGVIETEELFDPEREEFSRILASVSEWDDGTHLMLIYIMEDIYSTIHEALEHCGWETIVVRNIPARYQEGRPKRVYICYVTVTSWHVYRMPILAKSKARQYYDDLFAKIEAAMVADEPVSKEIGEPGNR